MFTFNIRYKLAIRARQYIICTYAITLLRAYNLHLWLPRRRLTQKQICSFCIFARSCRMERRDIRKWARLRTGVLSACAGAPGLRNCVVVNTKCTCATYTYIYTKTSRRVCVQNDAPERRQRWNMLIVFGFVCLSLSLTLYRDSIETTLHIG